MNAVYGVVLSVGLVGLIVWVVTVALHESGVIEFDPDGRFGAGGRAIVGGSVGFGMAGLSASYGGWPTALAAVGALAGAAAAAVWAARMGREAAS